MAKIPPLTYTLLSAFENCPHKAMRQYIVRDLPRTAPTPELAWGREVHEAFEARLGKGTPLPEAMQAGEPLCLALERTAPCALGFRVEYYLGVLPDGQPCQPDNKSCWFRGKSDAALWSAGGAWLVDWKTGKIPQKWVNRRPEGEDPFELECQAMLLGAHHGPFHIVVGEYFGLKEGLPGVRHTLDPKATRARVMELDNQIRHYHQRGDFPKKPNPLCGWCDVTDCEHNRRGA